MTRESKSVEPSSRVSAGILPSGFWRRIASAGSLRSVSRSVIRSPRPSRRTAMRTLRTKGEAAVECRIIIAKMSPVRRDAGHAQDLGGMTPRVDAAPGARRMRDPEPDGFVVASAHDEIDRLRTLALLVGLDIERDALPFVEALEAGRLDRRDMHEHVTSAVIRLDEAVTALTVEELDHALLRHRETPTRTATGPTHGGAA